MECGQTPQGGACRCVRRISLPEALSGNVALTGFEDVTPSLRISVVWAVGVFGIGLASYWRAFVQSIRRKRQGTATPPNFPIVQTRTAAITPGGRVDFEGKLHTAVLGPRSRTAGRQVCDYLQKAERASTDGSTRTQSAGHYAVGSPEGCSGRGVIWLDARRQPGGPASGCTSGQRQALLNRTADPAIQV